MYMRDPVPKYPFTWYVRDTEEVRELRVRQLFQLRYPTKPDGMAVLAFYGWLYEHNPALLPKEKGGPYQHLKSDLVGLYNY